jgi:hypothetical protein
MNVIDILLQDDFTQLMVEFKLGFEDLHESEKQKIKVPIS